LSSSPTDQDQHPGLRDRQRERVVAARDRYEHSWFGEIGRQLKDLNFVNWITILGASLLWSAVPLIILLSSFANERIDDDLSRHIGLSREGARLVHSLFRGTPAHGLEPILTGFIFSFAGVIATVSSLQQVYERVFGQEPRGWRDLYRWVLWTGVLLALLVADGLINGQVRGTTGPAPTDVISLVVSIAFFWWTMHFLLAGRTPWARLWRPAVVTGGLWMTLALLSPVYFSPLIVSDSHTYGTIGVVFSLLTWFFLMGAVLVLGAVLGAAWQHRAERADAPESG